MAYVALLRGVNVGGKHSLPMEKVRAVCEKIGGSSVATYIQSGNVVLRHPQRHPLKFAESIVRKMRFAQLPFVLGRVLEIGFCVALLIAFTPMIARHATELRYLLIGVPMVALTVAITAVGCHSLTLVGLDYGGPVAELQRQVARSKQLEYRAFAWALFGGAVFWLPAFLLVVEAMTGYPALANVDLAWLVGNLVVGAVLLGLGLVLAKRFATNSRVVDAVTGKSLQRVERYLDELAQFQRD